MVSDQIVELVRKKMEWLDSEAAKKFYEMYTLPAWYKELGSVTLNLGRRMGHTTALCGISKLYPTVVVVPYQSQADTLSRGKFNGKIVTLLHGNTLLGNLRGIELKDSILAVDCASVVDKYILEQLSWYRPKLILLVG